MGQQQLLLVILVTIIVGIATVVAINTFGSAADQSTVDGARQDLIQIGASANGYYMRPDMMGGGGQSFTGITWEDITFGADSIVGTTAYSQYGTYALGTITADNFPVTATVNLNPTEELPALVCSDDIAIGDLGDTAAPTTCD